MRRWAAAGRRRRVEHTLKQGCPVVTLSSFPELCTSSLYLLGRRPQNLLPPALFTAIGEACRLNAALYAASCSLCCLLRVATTGLDGFIVFVASKSCIRFVGENRRTRTSQRSKRRERKCWRCCFPRADQDQFWSPVGNTAIWVMPHLLQQHPKMLLRLPNRYSSLEAALGLFSGTNIHFYCKTIVQK